MNAPFGSPRRQFVGFYWTFGDTRPPQSDADLERLSFTVRAQRRMVAAAVQRMGGEVVGHFAYQERGHRPSAAILGTVNKAIRECRQRDATLIYVALHDFLKWRPHRFLMEAMDRLADSAMPVSGDDQEISRYFAVHRDWTTRSSKRRSPDHRRVTTDKFDEILGWQIADMALPINTAPREIARRLNARGFRTFTGARWTDANARHAMKRLADKGFRSEPPGLGGAPPEGFP